ncbi:hypothetical protein OAM01_02630 [bacterium]|nr:hypothetical protein [bacterium]
MDLQAPQNHGWLSDHEIFFLREKNQGDFLCVKKDIRDGTETVLEELSPFLENLEERSKAFFMKSSPSGKRLALMFGERRAPTRILFDLKLNRAIKLKNSISESYLITWLTSEEGWISWQFDPEMSNGPTECAPSYFSAQESEKKTLPMVIEGSPLTPPIMVNSTNLVFPVKHSGKNLVLESFIEHPKHVFKKSISHTIATEIGFADTHIDATQKGNTWLFSYMVKKPLPKIIRWRQFPYVRLISLFRYEAVLFDFQKQRITVIESDLASRVSTRKFPHRFDLNPSGTHLSFMYQGQIWVAKISDFFE